LGKIITVANQKGGVAKTTTAVNLSAGLAALGKKVLLIDLDPQGNATSGVGINKAEIKHCVYDALINEIPLNGIVQKTALDTLFAVPATIQLAGAEVELVSMLSREMKLKKALLPIKGKYDYIIIDCPPSLGLLTLNAMTAADCLLIPIQCEYYALEGLSQLMSTISLVKKHLNPSLDILGVALTMFDVRTNLSTQVVEEVRAYFKELVFETIIQRNIRLSEAPSYGKPIILYDAKSKGAENYNELAKEVIQRD
jgi:chromosome partitioning protein